MPEVPFRANWIVQITPRTAVAYRAVMSSEYDFRLREPSTGVIKPFMDAAAISGTSVY
ncbi:hypothetical protein [Halorubrum sp. Ea8]|uniref:hypothetical protein n=1 Tax=Halorubrum sp. Ea8 TaxID=1383841 RepID=UPI0015960035|nr:hypothetical protein [Halorubrum sp. Ea8]